jgi:uncharacterized YigZ family protein
MRIVFEEGNGEVIEKKSRFISLLVPVESEEKANEIIERTKKKYWDARHNCYAYIIGSNAQICRYSDDGEPQGTAGKPMLEVLLNENITNVLVIVTRYFGGTLLGTGGLVRAYQQSVKEAIENALIAEEKDGIMLKVISDYTGAGKIQRLGSKPEEGIFIRESEYTDKVETVLLTEITTRQAVIKKITEITNGQADISDAGNVKFIIIKGKAVIL